MKNKEELVFALYVTVIEEYDLKITVNDGVERYTIYSPIGFDLFYLDRDIKTGKLDLWREKIFLEEHDECELPTNIKPDLTKLYALLLKKKQDQLLETIKENIDSIYEFSGRPYVPRR